MGYDWNKLKNNVINSKTERLDVRRLIEFSTNFVDSYWDFDDYTFGEKQLRNVARILLSMIISFVAYEHEADIIDNYINLYKVISGVPSDENIKTMHGTTLGFPECREIIWKKALERGYGAIAMEDLARQMNECKKYVKHPFNLETIYFTLLNFNDMEPRFEGIPVWHMAHTIYLIYRKNPSPVS